MISKEQERSKFALDQIKNILNSAGRVPEDIANFMVGAPTMILQNGFGQTMAFLLSKCKGNFDNTREKHYFTFKAIAGWCERENSTIRTQPSDFFYAVSQLSQHQYLTLQEESLKMLNWLKRYARAFQEDGGNEQED